MFSTLRTRSWLPALTLLVGLGIGGQAHADGKVDWSGYLEPAGYKTPVKTTPAPAVVAEADTKAEKPEKKPARQAALVKPKAKAKAKQAPAKRAKHR